MLKGPRENTALRKPKERMDADRSCQEILPYSGEFSYGAKFSVFR